MTKERPPPAPDRGVVGGLSLLVLAEVWRPNQRTRRILHRRRGTVPLGIGAPCSWVQSNSGEGGARVMRYVNVIDSEYTYSGISTRHIAHQSSVSEMTFTTLYRGSGGGKPRGRAPMLLQQRVRSPRWNGGWGMVSRPATRRRLEVGVGRLANYSHTRRRPEIYEVSYA